MKESQIQKQIVDYLKASGFFVIRNYMGPIHVYGRDIIRPNPNAGMPDLMAIKAGLTHFIEVKTKTGKLSDKQKQWIEKAYRAGLLVHVFRSLDDCKEVF